MLAVVWWPLTKVRIDFVRPNSKTTQKNMGMNKTDQKDMDLPEASQPLVEVAMAILHQEGRFLMQLRDDFSHIVYPGCWGFFGGHLEPGEAVISGVQRELVEELGYVPEKLSLFQQNEDNVKRRYYYYGALTVPLEDLQLNEGQDFALCSPEEIEKGEKYSARLGEVRSLGKPHQQVLRSFLESGLMMN